MRVDIVDRLAEASINPGSVGVVASSQLFSMAREEINMLRELLKINAQNSTAWQPIETVPKDGSWVIFNSVDGFEKIIPYRWVGSGGGHWKQAKEIKERRESNDVYWHPVPPYLFSED